MKQLATVVLALIISGLFTSGAVGQAPIDDPDVPVSCEQDCRDDYNDGLDDAVRVRVLAIENAEIRHDHRVQVALEDYIETAAGCFDFACVMQALNDYQSAVDASEDELIQDVSDIEDAYDATLIELQLELDACLEACIPDVA
ncbi:MAG: hypothetical protein Phyf2KO_00750 [Phycisphaerales bacterium]